MPLEIHPVTSSPGHNTLIHGKDVAATLQGLDGAYNSKDLYRRYLSACRESGRSPASQNRFSRAVAAYGFDSWRTATARGWHIHTRWVYATS